MKKFLFGIIFGLSCFGGSVFSADEMINVYLNAGTEKYLQGDYSSAVDNLEKAYELDKNNEKVKGLLVKVIVDAGTNYNLMRDYQKAVKYLERGIKIAPDDEKINELYRVTNETLSRGKVERAVPKPEPLTQPNAGLQAPALKPEARKTLETASVQQKKAEEKVKTVEVPAVSFKPAGGGAYKALFLLMLFLVLFLIVFAIAQAVKINAIKLLLEQQKTAASEQEARFETEKTKFIGKIEKDKDILRGKELEIEKLSLEKKMRAELDKKLSEIARQKEPELARVKLETKNAYMKTEQRDLGEFARKTDINDNKNIFVTQPPLEQARDRIANRSVSLYEQSPEAALAFLKETAANPNPGVRSNVVKALAVLAVPETLELLFALNNDTSESVRREVIKAIRMLGTKINNAEIQLPENIKAEIFRLFQEELDKGEWIF
ncbi:MAG: hypothetical protein A2297_00980 [Elusimicrobia bacterium RIFOXYB2_FULL_48_7]|nr:MAG: hypothetical protein A2297_00980 [Elusimicrobia bacterium RIFOXYB2_FULL_48_7]